MKVSGFTIVRNAVKYDYPVVESITSALPLCDELIVSVGNSEDETLSLIQSIPSSKIKIMLSQWDDRLREGGKLLAAETNKAKQQISSDADWCFYLQADEILHERDQNSIRQAMAQYLEDKRVEGLLFNYRHFYGSYQYVADAYNWYRKEIRIVRNDPHIFSWGDAQGFRFKEDSGNVRKLRVKLIDASIYHYGWVKEPQAQQRKQESFHKMWHDDEWMQKNIAKAQEFDYSRIDSLQHFTDSHPAVMKDRITRFHWQFEFDTTKSKMKWKYRLRRWMENNIGWNMGEYRNYELI